MTTFPYGYKKDANNTPGSEGMGTMLTVPQLLTKQTITRLHPEAWRRVLAMMTAAAEQGIPLGVGGGWRIQPTNPDGSTKPGFAAPGNSYHEGFPVGPNSTGALACDMVPKPSWPWQVQNAHRFGLRTFVNVNNEPWHVQPAEVPTSRQRRTQPWVLDRFPLPGEEPLPQPPEPPQGDDLVLTLYIATENGQELDARFIGWTDSEGWGLSVQWLNETTKHLIPRARQTLTRNTVQIASLDLEGPMPTGDRFKTWSKDDFRFWNAPAA